MTKGRTAQMGVLHDDPSMFALGAAGASGRRCRVRWRKSRPSGRGINPLYRQNTMLPCGRRLSASPALAPHV